VVAREGELWEKWAPPRVCWYSVRSIIGRVEEKRMLPSRQGAGAGARTAEPGEVSMVCFEKRKNLSAGYVLLRLPVPGSSKRPATPQRVGKES